MDEISALERELAEARSEAAAWAERAEERRFVIETSIKTVAALEAENVRLRAALQEIIDDARTGWTAADTARRALDKAEP
jgi:hypothetical protein